ncbi:MAG: hypothetical protein NUW01_02260 [Gemmatimonadaceae bacterium]|nr:hypothetical protein [Gemmatimonadaceae bacterium]
MKFATCAGMNRLSTVTLGLAMLGATAAPAQTRIEAGETVSGSLTPRDSRMYNGAHFELWIYSGSRGERLFITLRSIQFDAYLLVQPFPGGRSPLLARDDDSGGGSDARVEFVLPEDGDYVITATSAERGETGAYRLSVQRASTAARPQRTAPPATTARAAAKPTGAAKPVVPGPRVLAPGRTVAGTLSSTAQARVGVAEGVWRYVGHAGETITLDMRSSEFDPFLTLYSIGPQAATRVAQDDNGGGGLNSRIVYRIPADGEYVARAERRQPGRSGSYTLSFNSSARASRFGLRSPSDRTIAPNSAVSSELDGSDPKMRDGTPYELWTYVGRSGETIRITLRSDDFDAFVSIGTITNGVFTAIESADDGAGGTHSRLDITLPFAGEYVVRANSLSPRRPTGDYILRIDSLR